MYTIQLANPISPNGLKNFDIERYTIADNVKDPNAILVRSSSLHDMPVPQSLLVVGRAGAGTNNIPIERLTKAGIPVLNTPGANANAVKELVLTGLLMACRNVCKAWTFMQTLSGDNASLHKQVESQKKQFIGTELPGKTLGVIGLGSIGIEIANTARYLGMKVIGYDPALSVKNAWKLRSSVKHAENISEVLKNSDFISLHMPLNEHTRHFINQQKLSHIKKGAILLNFARADVVDSSAIETALNNEQLGYYVSDFPDSRLQNHPNVITLPHLGASTQEAQENCAIMISQNVKTYLELGHINHSINFPSVHLEPNSPHRLAIINENIPNMVAQISTVLSNNNLNIADMVNKSLNDIAYTLIDVEQPIQKTTLQEMQSIKGVIRTRYLTSACALESV